MIPPSPIGSKFEEPADTMPSVAAVVTGTVNCDDRCHAVNCCNSSIACCHVTCRIDNIYFLPNENPFTLLTTSAFATVACAVQLAIRPEPLPKVTRARKFFISVVKPFTSDSTARR